MNVDGIGLFSFVLFVLAILWGFWLIFKRDLLSINLGKLISYFLGVIFTMFCVWLIVTRFVPWWTRILISDTQNSQDVQAVEVAVQEMWKRAVPNPQTTVVPAEPVPTETSGGGTGQPTVEPTEPAETLSGQSQMLAGERTHVVQSGDTIYNLSRKYGVTEDALRQRNNLSGDTIKIGQQLIIPAP